MRHVAHKAFGDGLCEGVTPMTVPISRGPMPADRPDWVAYIGRGPGPPPYALCHIVLADVRWPTEYLCRVIAHEAGHMAGLDHDPSPRSIMFAGELPPWAPCADGAAEPRRFSASPA